MDDRLGAREELRALFHRTVAALLTPGVPVSVDQIVDGLMRLCWEIGDDWDKIYVTEMRDAGDRWLDQRYIRVRIPREAKQGDRIPDRTVPDVTHGDGHGVTDR